MDPFPLQTPTPFTIWSALVYYFTEKEKEKQKQDFKVGSHQLALSTSLRLSFSPYVPYL